MSTIVVAKKNSMVAIGCDTLTKLGRVKEQAGYIRNHSKLIHIGDSHVATVGHASNKLVLQNVFKTLKSTPPLDSVHSIFETSCQIHRKLKEDFFLNPNEDDEDEYESLRMDCLIANPAGIFGLYALRSVQEYTKFYAFGSGWRIALGAMYAIYDIVDNPEEIVKTGLQAAAEFDDSTGLPIDISSIQLRQDKVTVK